MYEAVARASSALAIVVHCVVIVLMTEIACREVDSAVLSKSRFALLGVVAAEAMVRLKSPKIFFRLCRQARVFSVFRISCKGNSEDAAQQQQQHK